MTQPVPRSAARPGRLFVISAPSGAGKTTLCRAVMERFPDLQYSISTTTRPPRPGETHGSDYFFCSIGEFESHIRNGNLAEWAKVHGHYYGTSAEFLDAAKAEGRDILLDIDVQGTRQILKAYPESVTIFILPVSLEILRERLENRRSDPPEVVDRRLTAARAEIAQKDIYRYHVVNDTLPEAVDQLSGIIDLHRSRG